MDPEKKKRREKRFREWLQNDPLNRRLRERIAYHAAQSAATAAAGGDASTPDRAARETERERRKRRRGEHRRWLEDDPLNRRLREAIERYGKLAQDERRRASS